MNKANLTLCLMALLLVTVTGADSETKEIPTMTVGQTAQGFIFKADRFKSYHLVSVPTIDKKYLFVTLSTEEVYNHLNISLLIYKQGKQVPLQKCVKEQLDSCYIPKFLLQVNETLFVVVQSDENEEITYKLNTYWSDLEHINLNEELRFMFSENEQKQIYHLELEGQEFKELRILIKPETRRYPFDKVKMYGTFGKDSNPSSQNFDFQSFPLWEDAEGVYLFRSEVKELTMNLVLYGMTETVYTLKCWTSNQTHSDLAIDSKIYEYLVQSERYLYHLQFKNKEGKYLYQTYVFRASIFNGDLQMKFYKDEQKKEQVTIFNPLMYMGDIQYIFHLAQLDEQVPNGLYIEVSSDTRITTYMMEFQGRTKTEALELNEHIYQFLYVENIERAYFKVTKFGTEDKVDKLGFKVTLSSIQVVGTVKLSLFICNTLTSLCLGENYQNSTTSISYEIRQVGTKKTYTFYMDQNMFTNVNNVEQHAIIVVVMTNQVKDSKSLIALEYNVGNRPEFLRENKPIEAHLRKNELKIYKYVCQDPSIKKVRIHINTIAGGFQAHSFRSLPSQDDIKRQTGRVMNGVVEATENLMKDPVVIVISGLDSATFSIVVQPVSQNKDDWSFITLSEDVEFKARIAPNKDQIFEIVPVASSIYFDYKATGTVHACKLNDEGICVDEENGPTLTSSGKILVNHFTDRKAYVRVSNPSSNRLVEVTTRFHSKQQDHCELIKAGELTREVFSEGKCLYSILHTLEDYEVMIMHEEYGPVDYKMLLCDKMLQIPHKENDQQRYYISSKMIKGSCQGHSQYTFTLYVIGDPSHLSNGQIVNPDSLFIKFIIQPAVSTMMLPDGLGYKSFGKTTEGPIKKFSFKLLNFIDTSIVVTTRNKLYFLVKVVEGVYREATPMSLTDFHFSSPLDKYFFLDSLSLKINGNELKKSTCSNCELLIYLYSKEPIGEIVEYTIEVSQNFFMLEQNQKKKNYLTQYSKAFYGYKAKGKGTVVVEVSDNNIDCAEIYASTKEYPDENNYIKRSFDGELMIQNTQDGPSTYYITVLARQNCAYSIGANLAEGERNLFKLERGILSHLSLKEGEVKYFTFKHLSDSPFKILSLHKYGRVEMYLNKTTQQQVAEFATKKNINYEDFQYRAEHKNRLLLNNTNPNFCKGCLYILAVVASKHTESSLYLGDDLTKVPLSGEKILNDILPEPSTTTEGQFYPMENGVLEVKVHSGKIKVTVNYKDQQIHQTFQKAEGKYAFNFTINLVKGYYGTATITIKAEKANSVYSLRVRSIESSIDEDTGVDYTTVNPDQANYIFLKDRLSCMKGFFKARDERIFVSFYSNEKEKLNLLQITGTLNGELTDISHDLTRNVMSVNFIKAANMNFVKGVPYQLCFSIPNNTLSAVVMQTEDTGTLPENVEMLVTGKQTYDLYPEGQFLLDIFECRGSATVAYGTSKKELQDAKEKVLEVVGMSDQTHAVKIQRGYFNMLLSINSPLALIRWLPIKESQEKGMGYYLYSAGTLKYDSVFGKLNFIVNPLKAAKKKTKTKIVDIKYSLYVSDNEQDLKQAGLCERYLSGSVLEYRAIHEQINTQQFKFSIDKNVIMTKYTKEDVQPENLFALIVADLTLQTPDQSQEYYRFVYNQQEIPAQLFKPSNLEEFQLVFIIVFLVVLTKTLFACAYLCTKVFVPIIMTFCRFKSRMLVEEGGMDNSKDNKDEMKQQQNLEPPPSSDRQNINVMTAPETEERMS